MVCVCIQPIGNYELLTASSEWCLLVPAKTPSHISWVLRGLYKYKSLVVRLISQVKYQRCVGVTYYTKYFLNCVYRPIQYLGSFKPNYRAYRWGTLASLWVTPQPLLHSHFPLHYCKNMCLLLAAPKPSSFGRTWYCKTKQICGTSSRTKKWSSQQQYSSLNTIY